MLFDEEFPETVTVRVPGFVLMISKPFCDVPVVPVAVLLTSWFEFKCSELPSPKAFCRKTAF